jgi:hypothetical protein
MLYCIDFVGVILRLMANSDKDLFSAKVEIIHFRKGGQLRIKNGPILTISLSDY